MDNTNQRIKEAEKRLKDSLSAASILDSEEGKFLLDYINERVSYLLNKMTANTPLDDRGYLSVHGGVKELQNLNTMLQSKAQQGEAAREEIDALRSAATTPNS